MEKEMAALLRASSGQPEYDKLMQYLMSRRAVPEMQQVPLGDRLYGRFSSNTFPVGPLPKNGLVEVNSTNTPSRAVEVLVHELTHAAQDSMGKQAQEGRLPPSRSQFRDGYTKIMGDRTSRAAKMHPEFAKEEQDYRATGSELQAFGVGKQATKMSDSGDGPDHLDSTMAQEFMILLDLALRDQLKKPPKGR